MTLNSIQLYETQYQEMIEGKRPFFRTPPDALVRAIFVESILPTEGGAKALEFGCGEGRNVEFLVDLGYDVTATDVSAAACDATAKRMGGKADIRLLAPGDDLPFESEVFGLVVCWEVLHWLGSEELFVGCLNEFVRVLKKRARIVFTMPTERHFLRFHAREVGKSRYEVTATSRQGCTLYAPDVVTVKALCEAAKLRIDRVMSYDYGDEKGENTLASPFSMYVFIASNV